MTKAEMKAETNDEVIPGGIEGLGMALLSAAERREGHPAPAAARLSLGALMAAMARADEAGSVCVRACEAEAELAARMAKAAADPAASASRTADGAETFDSHEALAAGMEALRGMGLAQPLSDFLAAAVKLLSGESAKAGSARVAPIVIDDEDPDAEPRFYLARLAFEEIRLAQDLLRLGGADAGRTLSPAEEAVLEEVTRASGADVLQRLAVRRAMERQFAVISGGPGTGKTTTVAQILECLLDGCPDLRIALAAPTGKAAGRMEQALMESVERRGMKRLGNVRARDAMKSDDARQIRSRTIHKWLFSPTATGEFPGPENPIEADVFIADEASMIDIHLALRLMDAIGLGTRVILLGDKHQLAAVGPGAVFAEISDPEGPLSKSVTELVVSRRFGAGTPIARLAETVNHKGEAAEMPEEEVFASVLGIFRESASLGVRFHAADRAAMDEAEARAYRITGLTGEARQWLEAELAGYAKALEACREAWAAGASDDVWEAAKCGLWKRLAQFRALASNRRGPMSTEAVNAFAEDIIRRVWPMAEASAGRFPGEVLIVRRNEEALGVHNGDIGIVLPRRDAPVNLSSAQSPEAAREAEDGSGKSEELLPQRADRSAPRQGFAVYFGDLELDLPAALLPASDPAWAITIHQSQGSEFDRVAVFLPVSEASSLATRELLYTAVTRTRGEVDVFGSEESLRAAVAHPAVRDGSLRRRLALGRIGAG